MPDELQEFLSLRRERDELVRKKSRLEGAESEAVHKLKETCGATNLKKAKEKLCESEKKSQSMFRKFQLLEEAWRKKWEGKI